MWAICFQGVSHLKLDLALWSVFHFFHLFLK